MNKSTVITSILFLLVVWAGTAQGVSEFVSGADTFFKAHVKNGRVDYKKIADDTAELDKLLDMAKDISVSTSKPDDYKAFWINAYNLAVIKGVANKYPIKSPMDVKGFFDKIKYDLGGAQIVLNDIENKMLRAKFPKESRFHFVLVCGGLGCPPIISAAYKPSTLDTQLTTQTKKAMDDPNFIRVNKNKVNISQIFEWYKGDFEHDGDAVDFINKYRSEQLPEGAKVSYYPYDWTLNATK